MPDLGTTAGGLRDAVAKRHDALEAEYRTGQEALGRLAAQQADLERTLLRISGALQVLRELLDTEPDTEPEAERDNGRAPGNDRPSRRVDSGV